MCMTDLDVIAARLRERARLARLRRAAKGAPAPVK